MSFFSCKKSEVVEYPLNITIRGPYSQGDYSLLQDSFGLKSPLDIGESGVFYILGLQNVSADTLFIGVSYGVGHVSYSYLCFTYLENSYLIPGDRFLGGDDLIEWDTLKPKSEKRYFYYSWKKFEDCELMNFSLKVKSNYFDSLNQKLPICYNWVVPTPICLNHPMWFFTIEDGHFIPTPSVDVQRKLDRSSIKVKRLINN